MELKDATLSDIKKYLDLTGRHGAQMLSLLGKITPGIHAILETEIGREILQEDIRRISELMSMIYEEKDTLEDKAELRYLRRRFLKISDKLRLYLEKTEEIKKVVSEP